MYKRYFKRCIDFIIAFLALVIIGWFILLVAIMLHFANKGAGAFFLQERPGKDGKPFKVIKFKTMTDERGADGELLPDVQRITKIGKLVRSLSIDELPQFINVFKGDMSLIGPRPLLMHYLPWYTPEQARRHEVRPGITGWAQVNGRNHCKLSKKFELDVWYVDHCTLATDLKICKMTILNIIKREDVGEGTGNMEEVDDLGFHQRYLELLEQRKKND
jgi:lipopolysaccharide/colanic/teichoic acid biosynthesis glycosyltransferase